MIEPTIELTYGTGGYIIGLLSTIFILLLYKLFKKKTNKLDFSQIRTMIVEANKEMNEANKKLIELNKAFEDMENV